MKCPVVELDRAEGRATGPMIVHLAVDDELTREFVQGLLAERVRPPQLGLGHVDRPLDPVLADRGWMVEFVVDPGDVGTEQDRSAVGVVEDAAHSETGPSLIGIGAHDTEVLDRARAGLVDRDFTPDAAGVVAGRTRQLRVEDGAHQVAAFVGIAERRHCDVDGETVLVGVAHQVRDLELVRDEVAVGIAHVGTVEPDITLLGDPVQGDPAAPILRHGRHREAMAVEDRAFVGEVGRVGPVAGHGDLGPVAVVECRFVEGPAELLTSRGGTPRAGQVHP